MYAWKTYRSRIARLSIDRPADDPDLLEARRDLVAARLLDCARAANGPHPITDVQRRTAIAILSSGVTDVVA